MLPTDKQARKERPIASGVLSYFPDAIAEVAYVSYVGNQQHNPGQPMHWSRHKSTDHADCALRHLTERGTRDSDGVLHTAKAAWRVLALLQIELENVDKQDGQSHAEQLHAQLQARETSTHPTVCSCADTACIDREAAKEHTYFVGTQTLYAVKGGDESADLRSQRYNDLLHAVPDEDLRDLLDHSVSHPLQCRTGTPKYCYIAGPMRGKPEFNFPAFDNARDYMNAKGWRVISPADIDRNAGISESTNPASVQVNDSRPFVLRDFWALYAIANSHERGGIVMLPGWEASTGATAEFFLARWLGIPIMDGNGNELLSLDGGVLQRGVANSLQGMR